MAHIGLKQKMVGSWRMRAHLCELVMSDVAPGRWTVVSQAFTETNDPLQNIQNRWLHLHGTAKMWNNTLLSSEEMDHPHCCSKVSVTPCDGLCKFSRDGIFNTDIDTLVFYNTKRLLGCHPCISLMVHLIGSTKYIR